MSDKFGWMNCLDNWSLLTLVALLVKQDSNINVRGESANCQELGTDNNNSTFSSSDEIGETALISAAARENLTFVKFPVGKGATINIGGKI